MFVFFPLRLHPSSSLIPHAARTSPLASRRTGASAPSSTLVGFILISHFLLPSNFSELHFLQFINNLTLSPGELMLPTGSGGTKKDTHSQPMMTKISECCRGLSARSTLRVIATLSLLSFCYVKHENAKCGERWTFFKQFN